jgi:methionine-rich copper-binding protein CopC
VLIADFQESGSGYSVSFKLDPVAYAGGFESYNITVTFDPRTATLTPPSTSQFPGQLVDVNTSQIAQGIVQIAGISQTAIDIGSTLARLNFTNVTEPVLSVGFTRLEVGANGLSTTLISNANRYTYNSDGTFRSDSGASSGPDTTAPTVSSSEPGANATGTLTQNISLTFSEAVQLGSGSINLSTSQGQLVESFEISASNPRLSLSGATLTINPTLDLNQAGSYVLSLPAGGVKDFANNNLASNFSLPFRASSPGIDIDPPRVTSFSPTANATGVATSSPIVLQFSEEVVLGPGDIRILDAQGNTVASFLSGNSALSLSGDTLTIRPPEGLATATNYRLAFSSTALRDNAGNAFLGTGDYGFRTANISAADLRVVANKVQVNEGELVSFTISAPSLPVGTSLTYQIMGQVNSGDIQGGILGGIVTLGTTRTAQIGLQIREDRLTEGEEILILSVEGVETPILIQDTSTSARVPQQIRSAQEGGTVLLTSASDVVTGSANRDTAYINDLSSNYQISLQGNRAYISQLSAKNIDTLIDVERIQFSDKSVALDITGVPGDVYRSYKAAFARQPDIEGIGYWIFQMEQGMGLVEMAARHIDSSEFREKYGVNPSNSLFVERVYQNVLGRDSDETGLNFYVSSLQTGARDRAKVLADISDSSENREGTASLIAQGIDYFPWIFG